MFGAGHLAVTLINLLELEEQIAFVDNDGANKRGLFMSDS